ncbi:MAG: hypothetical protein E6J12_13685, partial [Chloroflexi bacterium]
MRAAAGEVIGLFVGDWSQTAITVVLLAAGWLVLSRLRGPPRKSEGSHIATLTLESSTKALSGITTVGVNRLDKLGIKTVRDLLLNLPFAWDSYGEVRSAASLEDGEAATLVGVISKAASKITMRKKMKLTQA